MNYKMTMTRADPNAFYQVSHVWHSRERNLWTMEPKRLRYSPEYDEHQNVFPYYKYESNPVKPYPFGHWSWMYYELPGVDCFIAIRRHLEIEMGFSHPSDNNFLGRLVLTADTIVDVFHHMIERFSHDDRYVIERNCINAEDLITQMKNVNISLGRSLIDLKTK